MPLRRPDPELDKKKPIPEPKPRPLTAEMRKRITREQESELLAKADAELEAKLNQEAEDAFLEECRQKSLEKKDPTQAKRPIWIDLPPEAPYLLTNGNVCYYPDTEYQVTEDVYRDLNSRIWMAWVNESQRQDDSTANNYKRSQNYRISRRGTTHD